MGIATIASSRAEHVSVFAARPRSSTIMLLSLARALAQFHFLTEYYLAAVHLVSSRLFLTVDIVFRLVVLDKWAVYC